MKILIFLSICVINIHTSLCQESTNEFFEEINKKYVRYNAIAADITWKSSITPDDPELPNKTASYQERFLIWQQTTCGQLATLLKRHLLNETQRRQTYILCRGPKFTLREAGKLNSLFETLQTIYSEAEICVPFKKNVSKESFEQTEEAIFDYLSSVKNFVTHVDSVEFAVNMAGNGNIDKKDALCLKGEEDFVKIMEFSRKEDVLRFLWSAWREKTGAVMRKPYEELVGLENIGAWRNGYSDIGSTWRDELEVPNIRQVCRNLYSSVRQLYTLLHGVVRYYLRQRYGGIVPERGPIPAHLLGNLWSQDWGALVGLISSKSIDLDGSITKLNWTIPHMVKRVEDFYQSMGLPAMTDAFWRESVFENKNGVTRCHGTAADMFKDGDFRLLYCSGKTMKDFYVLHHEFGHIQYYMAYEDQPGIFRQANAAFHESIGDAIMYGVMTPQHLNRLGLVNDSILYTNNTSDIDDTSDSTGNIKPSEITKTNDYLIRSNEFDGEHKTKDELMGSNNIEFDYNKDGVNFFDDTYKTKDDRTVEEDLSCDPIARDDCNFVGQLDEDDIEARNDMNIEMSPDDILLLQLALSKIPQIPFALVVDEYRWKYFEGGIDERNMNQYFWDLSLELQGVAPPAHRGEEYFDAGAKFHVPDNTPFIRYFLSSFLQHQIFEALCRAAVFGRREFSARIPSSISMHRCDIYGSKAAGKLLKDIMTRGHSQHWRKILHSTSGNTEITAASLKRYYRPLRKLLTRIVQEKNIPLGW